MSTRNFVSVRNDHPGASRARRQWHAQDDVYLEELIFLVEKLERHGPDSAQRCEILDHRYETFSLAPIARDPRRFLVTHDTHTGELTYLGITDANPGCEDAYQEALNAHNLVNPTRSG